MMFSYRLVRLIESHADALAAGLEERVEASLQVTHFRDIPRTNCGNASTKSIAIWASGCWARTNWISSIATARSAPGGRIRTSR